MLLTPPVIVIAPIGAPLHTGWLAGVTIALGVGLTVIVAVCTAPLHPFAIGITAIVAMTGVLPVLVPVNVLMLVVPLAANPIDGALFVQL